MGMVQIKSSPKELRVALVGNPNSGKTTIFNNLTGLRQHVGNWPGVTVEKKEGQRCWRNYSLNIVDLPGTYGLGAHAEDERITRNFLLTEALDVVVNVVDATNLERSLYLTVQLLEMGLPVVIALNFCDELTLKGIHVNVEKLRSLLGVPIVQTIATRNQGMGELLDAVIDTTEKEKRNPLYIDYGHHIETAVTAVAKMLPAGRHQRWMALRVLENDRELIRYLESSQQILFNLEVTLGETPVAAIATGRFQYIHSLVEEVVWREPRWHTSFSDRVDQVVTHKYLGIPIFLAVMWATFQFTFRLGEPLVGLLEGAFEWLGETVATWLFTAGVPPLLTSFLRDGVTGGVGAVLVFLPNIALLFLAISLLEGSGYMARAAYIMDRLMHALGLHGKSFIPLLLGFGCNVPAIMATRTLENRNDRLITILINPFMSCSARLPVYVLFAGAFFGARQGLVVFSLYVLGIVLAVLTGLLLRRFIFRGEPSYFVMELPPYRIPTVKTVFLQVWDRTTSFLRRAGTIIVAGVVVVWMLANLPLGVESTSPQSFLGLVGQTLAPLFRWTGFDQWEKAVVLLFGILAKEMVVGTLGVVYGVGEEALRSVLPHHWTPLSAYSFMVMTLIYIPCIATLATIRRETNSWKYPVFITGYSLFLGWLVAVLVFQGGRLFGLN